MRTAIELRAASPDETQDWHADWVQRTDRWYGPLGAPHLADRRQAAWAGNPGDVAVLTVDGVPVGTLATADRGDATVIYDIRVEPAHRGTGIGVAARTAAERIARDRGQQVAASVATDDPAAHALFAGYPLRALQMIKPVDPTRTALSGPGWRARAMTAEEYRPWRAAEERMYAEEIAGAGVATLEAATAMSEAQYAELLPNGLDSPGYGFWVVEADGAAVATLWLAHNFAPGVSFVYSVEVAPGQRGRGYGRAAMLVAEADTGGQGHPHLGLNVFGQNEVAVGLYRSLGYAVAEWNRSLMTGPADAPAS